MFLCCCTEAGNEHHQALFNDPQFPYQDVVSARRELVRNIEVKVKYEKGSSGKLGVDLDAIDIHRGLVVKGVLPDGLIAEWNRANPENAIKPSDKIFAVNNQVGTVQDLETHIVSSGPDLQLSVRRPQRIEVTLQRPGSLGLRLHFKKSSKGVLVSEVLADGLATDWNAKNPTRRITAGDRILEVNGEALPPEDLIAKLAKEDVMVIHMLHYDQDVPKPV
ncbi:unnamed protein product [Durusdinium trenchii]|uniref:PDZ domain-containing protein n=1 Tax=Durusdinium trenchii TaxID=1381693 RepID=A0ABP0N8P6_9DINO